MYEKKIHELEFEIGVYRYLEDLAGRYKAKFGNIGGDYILTFNPFTSPAELDVIISRRNEDGNMAFRVMATIIHYKSSGFEYNIHLLTPHTEKTIHCAEEGRQMAEFENAVRDDYREVMKAAERKTLRAINSLP